MTTIKLYADEHIRKQIVNALKNKGVDIISTEDAGNKGKSDEEQLNFAVSERRAILTRDTDYFSLSTTKHFGIIFITKRRSDKETLSRIIAVLQATEEDESGNTFYI